MFRGIRLIIALVVLTVFVAGVSAAFAGDWDTAWPFSKCTVKECAKKDKRGNCTKWKDKVIKTLAFRHAGNDLFVDNNNKGKEVVFNKPGWYFVEKHLDTTGWKWHVIVTNADKTKTYDIMHLDSVPTFNACVQKDKKGKCIRGEELNGKVIGKIADLSGKSTTSHVHIGYRTASFKSPNTYWGALPPKECTHDRGGKPDFPEKFERPDADIVRLK